MIRKAFGLAMTLAFFSASAAPLCSAASPAPNHACCGGPAKKMPAGPAGSCCRQALPSSAKAAAVVAPALAHPAPEFVSDSVMSAPVHVLRRVVAGSASPSPSALSPPSRA
ncbi:MAG: hypothetical protein ACHQ49_04495 [Elusimicrobiota bacterium]